MEDINTSTQFNLLMSSLISLSFTFLIEFLKNLIISQVNTIFSKSMAPVSNKKKKKRSLKPTRHLSPPF